MNRKDHCCPGKVQGGILLRQEKYSTVLPKVKQEIPVKWKGDNKPGKNYILPHIADRYARNHTGIQKDVMKTIHCATGEETTADKGRLPGQRKLAANIYSLHSFRHTFVSFCANAGVPLAVVAEIVGHGNPATREHYSHISTDSKRSAIKSLPSLAASVPDDDVVIDEPLSLQRKTIADALEKADSQGLG